MKKIKLVILFLSAISGIGGSYANANHIKFPGATYYGVTNGSGGFFWTKIQPNENYFYCAAPNAGYCTIVTRGGANPYAPVPNVAPTSSEAIPLDSINDIYKLI